jgi:hypothetical protein
MKTNKILRKFSEYQDFLEIITKQVLRMRKPNPSQIIKALPSLRTQLVEMRLPPAILRPQRRLSRCQPSHEVESAAILCSMA